MMCFREPLNNSPEARHSRPPKPVIPANAGTSSLSPEPRHSRPLKPVIPANAGTSPLCKDGFHVHPSHPRGLIQTIPKP